MKQFVQLFENFAETPGNVGPEEILKIFRENGLEAAIAAAKAAGMSKEDFTALVSEPNGSNENSETLGMQSDDSMNIVDGK